MPYATSGPAKYYELLDGVRYAKVSPKRTHARVQGAFGLLMARLTGDRGEWGPEWEFRVDTADGTTSILQPDVAFVSHARLDTLAKSDREVPPWSPDVAIEIRSPSSRPGLRAKKTARYLATGAVLVLDVDPAARTIAAHSAEGMRMFGEGERFGHPALPWLEFDVRDAFAGLDEE